MNKKLKVVIGACIALAAGSVICGTMIVTKGYDALTTGDYEEVEYEVDGGFADIVIEADCDDVRIIRTGDECRVVCKEFNDIGHDVDVDGDTLTIVQHEGNDRKSGMFFFNMETPLITVYLPESEYGKLTVRSDSGDVVIEEGLIFDEVDVRIETGDLECDAEVTGSLQALISVGDVLVNDVNTCELDITSVTGDIELNSVTAEDWISVSTITGDVEFDRCDAADVEIQVTTGDISGSFLRAMDFDANASTGDIIIPRADEDGGRCRLTTGTGDITIDIA